MCGCVKILSSVSFSGTLQFPVTPWVPITALLLKLSTVHSILTNIITTNTNENNHALSLHYCIVTKITPAPRPLYLSLFITIKPKSLQEKHLKLSLEIWGEGWQLHFGQRQLRNDVGVLHIRYNLCDWRFSCICCWNWNPTFAFSALFLHKLSWQDSCHLIRWSVNTIVPIYIYVKCEAGEINVGSPITMETARGE